MFGSIGYDDYSEDIIGGVQVQFVTVQLLSRRVPEWIWIASHIHLLKETPCIQTIITPTWVDFL